MKDAVYFVFLGAPGAGKGTQAAKVAEKLKIAHIASGDLFRDEVKKGTELGKLVKEYMGQGKLVPDDVTIKVISEKLNEPTSVKGIIFDGFPRTLGQAEALDKALAKMNKKVDATVYIQVPDADLLERLEGRWTCQQCQDIYNEKNSPPKKPGICDKCGGKLYQRPDDNEATIKNRIKVYHADTAPLIDYYKKAGKLITIDGTLTMDKVADQITKAIGR